MGWPKRDGSIARDGPVGVLQHLGQIGLDEGSNLVAVYRRLRRPGWGLVRSGEVLCGASALSHRFFLPCFEASNLRVGGSNPSRRTTKSHFIFSRLG